MPNLLKIAVLIGTITALTIMAVQILTYEIVYSAELDISEEYAELVERTDSKWSVSTEVYATIAADPERIVQNGTGIQITLKRKNLYLYASTDVNPIRFSGQSGIDINLDSIGVGGTHTFKFADSKNSASVFFDIGYYLPRYDDGYQTFPTCHSEGLWRYMNLKLATGGLHGQAFLFDKYNATYSGGIGAKIGASYNHQWTKNLSSGIGVKYRFLNLRERLNGVDEPNVNGGWVYISKRDFGGGQIFGTILKWDF